MYKTGFLFLCLNLIGLAQVFGQNPLQSVRTWDVIKTKSLNETPTTFGETSFNGLKLHFINEEYLAWENEMGYFLTPFRASADQLEYAYTSLQIKSFNRELTEVVFYDLPSKRHLLLWLSSSEADLSNLEAHLAKAQTNTTYGNLRTDGVYYHEENPEAPPQYFRIYPNGDLHWQTSDRFPEEETISRIFYGLSNKLAPPVKTTDYYQTMDSTYQFKVIANDQCVVSRPVNEIATNKNYMFYQMPLSHWITKVPKAEVDKDAKPPVWSLPIGGVHYISRSKKDIALGNKVFKVVEEMPRFPGCEDVENINERKMCAQQELLRFIYKNLVYPTEARQQRIEGTEVAGFVVETDGSISDIRVVRSISESTARETEKVVYLMQERGIRWIPGHQNGNPVRVRFNLPIQYRLE